MNTKEKKLELVKELKELMTPVDAYQDRPWTFVKFAVRYNKETHEIFGFSKVCRPDKWDAVYGIELAITKALYKLAKEILAKEE